MAKPTVGLTGGIACGKSTVAGFFGELGIPVVDADALARQVVEPGTEALQEIVEAFGPQVLQPDGWLDRAKLGDLVFRDAEARARLNAITHPRIARLSSQWMQALQSTGAPYLLYEAALLVENGIHRKLDALLVVVANPELQVERLRTRNGLDEPSARDRVQSQLSLERKIEVADYVIHNETSLEDTRRRVHEVHRQLVERFGSAAGGQGHG
jgi:dephospho-CoA kinase